MDAAELQGQGLSWDHVGGLPRFLDLLEYFANRIMILPEIDAPAIVAPNVGAKNVLVEPPVDALTDSPAEALVEEREAKRGLANTAPPPLENLDGPVAKFIAGRCDLGSNVRTTAKELYAGFQEWCRETGQDDISQRSFGMQLTAIGFCRRRRGRGKHWWEGIRLSDSIDEMAGEVAAGTLELINGHREDYQPQLAS